MKEVRVPRYDQSQVDGTLVHPKLPQPRTTTGGDDDDIIQNQNNSNSKNININNRFVICADTQYGMITDNEEWEIELEYSRKAITYINRMNPFPAFCCVCGDLTDMDRSFNKNMKYKITDEECDKVQKQQRHDFKMIWSELNDDIALICVCGNHDVGNRPTKHAIELYRNEFGDDHLAFWSSSNVYNIVVNTTLFSDPSYDESTEEMYRNQLQWLEGRLKYVRSLQPSSSSSSSQPSTTILVFGHHPWYLYDEEEDVDTMTGSCEWKSNTIPDSYFIIPKHRRKVVFELFRKYNVSASFSGHFHQNLVTETSFGMKMITTGPLSATLESSGKKNTKNNNNDKDGIVTEPNTLGLRVVEVLDDGSIKHEFVTLSSI